MSDTARVFDHVVIIMFENQYREYVMANPYFKKLASQGIDLANCFGVMHPSQTNYIASTAGELCNVTDDDRPAPLPQKSIVDLLEAAGLGWKAYMDGYTPELTPWTPDLTPADQYPYVIKHNPFSSFADILNSRQRWQRIVSEAQFWIDVAAGTLPEYSWFTPDMWNDGHYLRGTQTDPVERAPALVDQAAAWLEWFFGTLAFPGPDSLLPPRTLVVVNFDEADFEAAWDQGKKYTYDGPNQIYTVLLGDVVETGVEEGGYNHYSVLKTVEKNFCLGSLGKNDQDSNWLRFLWGERFAWGQAETTPLLPTGALAAAALGERLVAVYEAGSGLSWRSFDGTRWSGEAPVGQKGTGPLALGACGDSLVLAFRAPDGGIAAATYRPGSGWETTAESLVEGPVGALALSPCNRGADLMLVWAGTGGAIGSRRFRAGAWEAPVATGHSTGGAIALCALGHCLLLVYSVPESEWLHAVSYNTADFNVTTIEEGKYSGPYDDAVQDAWSPSAHPVAHFAAASSPVTSGEPEPRLTPYSAGAPLAMAELDGVVHLVHPAAESTSVVTETFSIAGLLTPKLAVSYRQSDEMTTSNGYGTLAEAGWSLQAPVPGVSQNPGSSMAAARFGQQVVLLHQPAAGEPVRIMRGGYATA